MERNVHALLAVHNQDMQTIASLQKENTTLSRKLQKVESEIEEQKREVEKARLLTGFTSSTRNRETNAQINKLLREIDRCIALVSKDI